MTKDEIFVSSTSAGSLVGGDDIAKAAVKAVNAGRAEDVDIAAQIIAKHGQEFEGEPWPAAEEKRLMRRIDWRLIPIVCIDAKPWQNSG